MRLRRAVAATIAVSIGAIGLTAPSAVPGYAEQLRGPQWLGTFGVHHRGVIATPGSPGSGDSLFPRQGNGGYDALHYDIKLAFAKPDTIHAVTTMRARSTQALSAFNLDFFKLQVTKVTLDGQRVAFSRKGSELTITPPGPIADDTVFSVAVSYHGKPKTFIDPDGSEDGWVKTSDGATVVSEPVGSMTWFPNNNTPRDKATYAVTVTAPKSLTVASNGTLLGTKPAGAHRTVWSWRESHQLASYLASVSIGKYDVVRGKTKHGIPIRSYLDPKLGGRDAIRPVGHVITVWSRLFGHYPFDSTGAIIDNTNVGYALEVQTRPIFTGPPDKLTLVHELAHQWFGDSVTPIDWSDIWLNEGFATYSQWLWIAESKNRPSAPHKIFQQSYDSHPASSDFWNIPVAEPGSAKNMFGSSVYLKGAMAVEAIRLRIGNKAFFMLLKRWTAKYAEANATTADLRGLAEQVSGKHLGHLFHTWLYSSAKPRGY